MSETAATIERASARARACVLGCVLATAVVVAGEFVFPGVAKAGWPLAHDARVSLGFGASYATQDGSGATHRGVDVAADEGERVLAPLAGRVTFAGSVPSAGGGTMRAVTIETAQGLITLMPLARFDVTRGAELAEGDGVGVIAATGDASSVETHLHVGARRGDLYVDPLGLIAPPVPQPAEQPESQPQPESRPQPTAATAGAPTPAPASAQPAASTPAGAVSSAPGAAAAPSSASMVPNGASVRAPEGRGAHSSRVGSTAHLSQPLSPAVQIAPGVTLPSAVSVGEGLVVAPGTARALALAGAPVRAAGVSSAAARSTEAASAGIAALATYGQQLVERGARTGALVAIGSLAALATLWPLWRAGTRIGIGKVPVSASADDVATVPSR